MKVVQKIIVLFVISLAALNAKDYKCAFLDATGRDEEVYEPFLAMARRQGLHFSYIPFDHLVTSKTDELLGNFDGVICACRVDLFSRMQSPLSQRILSHINKFAQKKNKLVGFLVPPLSSSHAAAQIFTSLLSVLYGKRVGVHEHVLRVGVSAITHLSDRRPLPYHTTLRLPSTSINNFIEHLYEQATSVQHQVALLPLNNNFPIEIKQSFPYGMYHYDRQLANHIFFGFSSSLLVLSIFENFHSAPMDYGLRHSFYQAYETMFRELKLLVSKKGMFDKGQLYKLAKQDPVKLQQEKSNVKKIKKKRHMAWMELVAFEPYKDDPKKNEEENKKLKKIFEQRQDELVDDIYASGLDTLWLSITPNIYYGPIARMVKKDNSEETKKNEKRFLHSVGLFTKKLTEQGHKRNTAPPKLILGFEIANNLYPPNLPQSYAQDIFGNSYTDLPAPLNYSFWYSEIMLSLDRFLAKWKQPSVCHGMKLSGVMIDLEMYCRQKTGVFTSLMGFDQESLTRFFKQQNKELPSTHFDHQVNALFVTRQIGSYWKFLEEEAQVLGKKMAQHFYEKIPECQIMCYLPSIMTHWFYKGFFKGLAFKKENPLHLLTFNAEYNQHRSWFVKNSIPVKHSCVLLLSKVKKPSDVSLVRSILAHHDGIWYNRFSRFAEEYNPKSWTSIEQSPMTKKEKQLFFEKLRLLQ